MRPFFNEWNEYPLDLLEIPISKICNVLKKPTLIHLSGKREPAFFAALLLHGNEHTGFFALQKLLKKYENKTLPRSFSFFIGNVEAAPKNLRFLPHQRDYNRIWSPESPDGPETQMAHEILSIMKRRGIFASVDLHNNTGLNPHYACISQMDPRHMNLALLFRRTVVFFTKPHNTQSVVFSEFVPSVTLECGLSEALYGVDPVVNFLDDCLHLSEVSSHSVAPEDIDLYETYSRLALSPRTPFAFAHEPEAKDASVVFRSDLDALNFSELDPGTLFGWVRGDAQLLVQDPDGDPFDGKVLDYAGGEIRTAERLIPSMFTLDKKVILQDCLGYMMKRKSIK